MNFTIYTNFYVTLDSKVVFEFIDNIQTNIHFYIYRREREREEKKRKRREREIERELDTWNLVVTSINTNIIFILPIKNTSSY